MEKCINGINWVEIEPMKYWSFTSATSIEKRKETIHQAIFGGEYMGSLKVDGYYQRIVKDEDGNCYMIARSRNVKGEVVNKIEWLPQINSWLEELPKGTCLLCECYLPDNEGSNQITKILGCLKNKAIERQKKEPLHLYVFDVMAYNGANYDNTPYIERSKVLIEVKNKHKSDYVEYTEFFDGSNLWEKLQDYLSQGREGMVIMRKDAKVYNKRTPARVSIKIKKELQETLDVIIIGANKPTRLYNGKEIETWKYWENLRTGEKINAECYDKYVDGETIEPVTKNYFNNWAGSLIIGVRKENKIIPIGSLSGMTEEVLSNWKDYKGKVAEITGMQIFTDTEGNGIRHPKFIKWRDDLTIEDTDWYRIFGA